MFCTYQSVDEEVATSALSTLKRHLWYLAEETVVLSLWSNNVPTEVKDSIAEEILKKADFDNKISLGHPTFPELTQNMELANLVGKNSSAVFRTKNERFILFLLFTSIIIKTHHVKYSKRQQGCCEVTGLGSSSQAVTLTEKVFTIQ